MNEAIFCEGYCIALMHLPIWAYFNTNNSLAMYPFHSLFPESEFT